MVLVVKNPPANAEDMRDTATAAAAAAAKSLQSCLILGSAMGCDLPGFSVHEIVKARILEWVAISCSTGSSQPRD